MPRSSDASPGEKYSNCRIINARFAGGFVIPSSPRIEGLQQRPNLRHLEAPRTTSVTHFLRLSSRRRLFEYPSTSTWSIPGVASFFLSLSPYDHPPPMVMARERARERVGNYDAARFPQGQENSHRRKGIVRPRIVDTPDIFFDTWHDLDLLIHVNTTTFTTHPTQRYNLPLLPSRKTQHTLRLRAEPPLSCTVTQPRPSCPSVRFLSAA